LEQERKVVFHAKAPILAHLNNDVNFLNDPELTAPGGFFPLI
jgi:hypothetical protein